MSTIPSSRWKEAPVGHTRTQEGFVQITQPGFRKFVIRGSFGAYEAYGAPYYGGTNLCGEVMLGFFPQVPQNAGYQVILFATELNETADPPLEKVLRYRADALILASTGLSSFFEANAPPPDCATDSGMAACGMKSMRLRLATLWR